MWLLLMSFDEKGISQSEIIWSGVACISPDVFLAAKLEFPDV
jgi:hypothetical protein